MKNNVSLLGLLLTAALVALGVTNPANATLFFSEGFAYANGDLAGNGGGTGWQASSVWVGGTGATGNQVANPLPGMSGKSIQITSVSAETSRPLSTTYTSGGATTYYISFAFNAAPFQGFNAGLYAGVSVFLASDRNNNLLGGMPGSTGALGFDWTRRVDQWASGVNGATYLVLLEIKPGTADDTTNVNMYATTNLLMSGAALAASTPWVAAGDDPSFSFDSVGIAGAYDTGTINLAGLAMADNPDQAVGFTRTAVNLLPTATTSAASSITTTGATLGGTVNDNGATTTVSFDYGDSSSYGTSTPATPGSIAAGTGNTSVTATLTGLSCSTTYHFRVIAVNSAGTSYGSDQVFNTSACVPTLSVANSPQVYTGSAIDATVTCSSGGAVNNIKYDGSSTVPINVGTYAVTANCASTGSYSALTDASAGNFVINPSGSTPGGTVTASIAGGDFVPASTQFTSPGSPPAGQRFPYDVFGFSAITSVGGSVTVTLTYPQSLQAGTKVWKDLNGTWLDWTSNVTINENIIVYTITDGGPGDADGLVNGSITDPLGPAVPSNVPFPIPTLSELEQIMMMLVMIATAGFYGWRMQQR